LGCVHASVASNVNPDFDAILALDAADRALAAVESEASALDASLSRAHRAESAAAAKIAEIEAALTGNEAAQRALEADIRGHAERRRSATRALEAALGDPDVAERQIAAARAAVAEIEDRQIELLEAGESLTGQRDAARRALADARLDRDRRVAAATDQRADLDVRRKAATAAGSAARGLLPRDLLGRYDMLRSKGFAVARIVDHACGACQGHVQAQHVAELRKGRLDPCRGCGRFLAP
jgi:predicted  nucleic acid-binding Zn-ribbon protein